MALNLEFLIQTRRKYIYHIDSRCHLNLLFSPANLRRSVELINEKLRGTKRLDLFQSARVDTNVPIEQAIATLVELKKEGKLDHIGMSECSAATLRRGNSVSHRLTSVHALVLISRRYTR